MVSVEFFSVLFQVILYCSVLRDFMLSSSMPSGSMLCCFVLYREVLGALTYKSLWQPQVAQEVVRILLAKLTKVRAPCILADAVYAIMEPYMEPK